MDLGFRIGGTIGLCLFQLNCLASDRPSSEQGLLSLPQVGSVELRILSPIVLELTLVTTKKSDPARVEGWDFVDERGGIHLPSPQQVVVTAANTNIPVQRVGFRRRVVYAPFKHRDLRIGNYLYLELAAPVGENQMVEVEVKNPDRKLWASSVRFTSQNVPRRWSPVIHINQVGYLPKAHKEAMIGYYLGSLGEMHLGTAGTTASTPAAPPRFQILEAQSGKEAYAGQLRARPDQGFPYECYQQVWEADFTRLDQPGDYRLMVPGFGASFPFRIDETVAGAFARTYALGIYHQRCGTSNELPFTRFTHGPCHTARAEVPDLSPKFSSVNRSLEKETANYKDNPRHTAPVLKNVAASLYPFVNRGPIDVAGGHHDAGDYSKYTINSAAFIHFLVFAADAFPGVRELDNLGLPESGDGKSDVLQEAKWEADFLAKMQDADGGFYFLVYPRDREYEIDVTPDHGDPQIVFPKTTTATAAAVAALAQCASSPTFRKQFPEAAAHYLEKAKKGWTFLERAFDKFGKDGAYQKITHYGDDFMHDDEVAWAACELYLATADPIYQKRLLEWFNPADPATRQWGWWRLYASYGCAIRSYAFAAKTGRINREKLHPLLLTQCEEEIAAAGEDQLRRARQSAYGTSFPRETKQVRAGGWYFSSDAAFDLATAYQLDYPVKKDPRPQMLEALLSNLNYELGCNPVNLTYLTGLGWKRQREIVHQFAQNDRRVLPPTGIPLGNIQSGFGWMDTYKQELGKLSFPSDGAQDSPYPLYDRWGDSFNLMQEFVIVNQAKALGYLAWLMAQTPLKNQAWKSVPAQIFPFPLSAATHDLTFGLSVTGLDLEAAQVVWEAAGQEPAFDRKCTLPSNQPGAQWLEAEAQWPDGRRAFAVTNLVRSPTVK